jgi:hypothetical protein
MAQRSREERVGNGNKMGSAIGFVNEGKKLEVLLNTFEVAAYQKMGG